MKLLLTGIALLFATTSSAQAQDLFTGTWKGDVKASQPSPKPSVILIDKGIYSCSTCKPAVTVAADGAFHPVVGNAYYDEISVTVVDPATLKRATRKAGKPVGEATSRVSADGKTLTTNFTDMSAANGTPVTGTNVGTRVAAAAPGAHAASGSWRETNDGQVSDSGIVFTLAQTGKVVRYSTPTGVSYEAMIGGAAAPVVGDPGWTMVSLKPSGRRTLVETDLFDGKVIGTYAMTIAPDGKKMTIAVNDVKYGKRSTLVAFKQ